MISRCRATSGRAYRYYGMRGITVCERWAKSFAAFLADMGPRPTAGHSLDRYPNQDGNYEPGNCRWATQPEQLKNSRKAHKITFDGKTMCVTEWAAEIGIDYTALIRRIQKWGIERALTTPVNAKFRNGNAGKRRIPGA